MEGGILSWQMDEQKTEMSLNILTITTSHIYLIMIASLMSGLLISWPRILDDNLSLSNIEDTLFYQGKLGADQTNSYQFLCPKERIRPSFSTIQSIIWHVRSSRSAIQ